MEPAPPSPLIARVSLPRQGVDEDAEPLVIALPEGREGCVLGVFDGMGGAGGRIVEGEHGARSSAWYASRLARGAALNLLESAGADLALDAVDATVLTDRIVQALREANARSAATGAVRSRMMRPYPTTAAVFAWERGGGGTRTRAVWAGDSRCYVMDPGDGLHLLTRDESIYGDDPMLALREDPRLRSALDASGQGRLRQEDGDLPADALIAFVVATDGAFGCLPSPMHFEWLLLDALAGAPSTEAFETALADRLLPIQNDDISLLIAFVGFPDLAAADAAFAGRRAALAPVIARLDAARAENPEEARAAFDEAWALYRENHLRYLPCEAPP